MFETGAEITELQAIMDRSHERLGTHAAAILTPARRLTARQVVNYLTGMKHIVVGTVTAGGEPRVGAVDGHFIHGRFWFGTSSLTTAPIPTRGREGIRAGCVSIRSP